MSAISKIKVGGTTYDIAYPVGSIYLSVNDTSPAELFGGTWEQIKDTFLLAAGDTYSAGSTGGEAQHTLTTEEMPQHSHIEQAANSITTTAGRSVLVDRGTDQTSNGFVFDLHAAPLAGGWNQGKAIETLGVGSSLPHNNMPPYLSVYAWKRIA